MCGADLACQSLDITVTIEQAIRIYSASKGFRHVEYQITPRFVCLLNDAKVIFRKDVNSTQITQSHGSWATTISYHTQIKPIGLGVQVPFTVCHRPGSRGAILFSSGLVDTLLPIASNAATSLP